MDNLFSSGMTAVKQCRCNITINLEYLLLDFSSFIIFRHPKRQTEIRKNMYNHTPSYEGRHGRGGAASGSRACARESAEPQSASPERAAGQRTGGSGEKVGGSLGSWPAMVSAGGGIRASAAAAAGAAWYRARLHPRAVALSAVLRRRARLLPRECVF